MRAQETGSLLSDAYVSQLAGYYSDSVIDDITHGWKYADLTHQPGEKILYVRVGQEDATYERPVLYVPGFTEGIVAKAPFAAEMAEFGFDFILPDQNRKEILKDALNKKSATYSQAVNYLDVLSAEALDGQTVDVITHSYGNLIFQAMLRIAKSRGQTTFDGAKLIELAPAGTNARERLFKIAPRLVSNMIAESRTQKDFPDPKGEMTKAGAKNFVANIPRTVREIFDVTHIQMDYEWLATSGLASMTVVGYAQDRLYPHRVLKRTMAKALSQGVSYTVPFSLQDNHGRPRGGQDASHNDEQFNPSRVAGAVAQILRRYP